MLQAMCLGLVSAVTDTCTSEGLICGGDTTVSLCIDVEACSPGFHCAYTTKKCVSDTFKCHQAGVFPDPYDCHKYYTCGENAENLPEYDGEAGYCVRYYHFNVASGQCEVHNSPGECEEGPQAVPECSSFLQTGALEANSNYYYVCAKGSSGDLYPKVYKCADKEYYDAERKVCVQEQNW
ncbi:hypothetical protein C0J52_25054 [Blattella germanica]|nr:hypothetical protein C0J52_25054 [Blattella germanica]